MDIGTSELIVLLFLGLYIALFLFIIGRMMFRAVQYFSKPDKLQLLTKDENDV